MKSALILLLGLCAYWGTAQTITTVEYFIDSDGGAGNGTTLTLNANSGVLNQSFNIPTTNISEGFHSLYVRAQASNNEWSLYNRVPFLVRSFTNPFQSIVAAEYFFDTDSGFGANNQLAISASEQPQSFSIPTIGLSEGFHDFYLRVKTSEEKWSLYDYSVIFVTTYAGIDEPIVAAEYFFDEGKDPGLGTPLTIDENTGQIAQSFAIPTTDLAEGLHTLYIRVKTESGNWSLYDTHTINVSADAIDNMVSVTDTTLTANLNETGTLYQWINCATNIPIDGANGRSYTAVATGDYAVEITLGSQTVLSTCTNIIISDSDGDGILDVNDNCPLIANADQADDDQDGIGNVCDDDWDNDTILNDVDNCPLIANVDQLDTDSDGQGDICDTDDDGDGIADNIDNCPLIANADQADGDQDGIGDVCDDDWDQDGDGIANNIDNCPLTANADQADWDQDGIGDVCDDDLDNDGLLNDDDMCNDTPAGAVVGLDGCEIFALPSQNFTIKSIGESCASSNNAIISISALSEMNYTATLSNSSGNIISTQEFMDELTFSSLAAGEYVICITVSGQTDYEQCSEVSITEPETLSASSKVNATGNKVTISLNGGNIYNIVLNDNIYQTSEKEITLDLNKVENTLSIKTDKDCQGIYEEIIILSSKVLIYPNPISSDVLNIYLGSNEFKNVQASMFNISGSKVLNENYNPINGHVKMDITELAKGVYLLNIKTDKSLLNYKIIKQ